MQLLKFLQGLPKNNLVSIVFAMLVVSTKTTAQNSIAGFVYNSDNQPIGYAMVQAQADSTVDALIHAVCMANAHGFYNLKIDNKIASYYIKYSMLGYKTTFIYVVKNTDSLVNKNIVLPTMAKTLAGVTVINTETAQNSTKFSADSFAKPNQDNIQDLLRKIPGITIQQNKLYYKGKLVNRILVEGDDLFGNNYNALLKNLSTNGVDSIEIINNYLDKSNLENAYKKYGDELVIDLKFKGKKAVRTFARGGVDVGLPTKVYETKFDAISLLKNVKIINFLNANSRGYITSYLLQKSENYTQVNFNTPTVFEDVKQQDAMPITQKEDIAPYFIGEERIYNNQSKFITTDYILKAKRNLTIKGFANFQQNKTNQTGAGSEFYFDTTQIKNVIENTHQLANRNQFSIGFATNWIPNGIRQYTTENKFYIDDNVSHTTNNINNTISTLFNQTKQYVYESKHSLIFLLPRKQQLVFNGLARYEHIGENFNINTNFYKDYFSYSMLASTDQMVKQKYLTLGVSAEWKNEIPKNKIQQKHQLDISWQWLPFISQLQLYDSANNVLPIANNFENNLTQFRKVVSLTNQFGYKTRLFKKALGITFKNKVKYIQQNILDKSHQQEVRVANPFQLLPFVEFNYSPIKKIYTTLYLQRVVNSSKDNSYYKGIIMDRFRSFRAGLDTLAATFANIIGSTFYINDNRGYPKLHITFYHSASNATNTPIFKTQNYFTYAAFHLQQINTTSNNFNVAKSVSLKKVFLNFQGFVSSNKSNYKLNNNDVSSKYYTLQTVIFFSYIFNNNLQYNFNVDRMWAYFNQSSANAKFKGSFSNGNLTQNISATIKDTWALTISNKNVVTKSSYNPKPLYFFFCDIAAVKAFKKDNIKFRFQVQNILNKNKYATTDNNTIGIITREINILPRFFLLGIETKF